MSEWVQMSDYYDNALTNPGEDSCSNACSKMLLSCNTVYLWTSDDRSMTKLIAVQRCTEEIIFEFFLNVFTAFGEFSDKNICHYSKSAQTCKPATFCVRDQDSTTVPARFMWETGSLNWAQFIFQWFIRFSEFAEFLFHLGKRIYLLLKYKSGFSKQPNNKRIVHATGLNLFPRGLVNISSYSTDRAMIPWRTINVRAGWARLWSSVAWTLTQTKTIELSKPFWSFLNDKLQVIGLCWFLVDNDMRKIVVWPKLIRYLIWTVNQQLGPVGQKLVQTFPKIIDKPNLCLTGIISV